MGEFANEVVNQASKKASRGWTLGLIPLADIELWFSGHGLPLTWAASVCASLRGDVSMPPVCGQSLGDDLDLLGMSPRQILEPFLVMLPVDDRADANKALLLLVAFLDSVLGMSGAPLVRNGGSRKGTVSSDRRMETMPKSCSGKNAFV